MYICVYIHTSRCTCTTCIRVDVHVHVDALNSSHVAAEVRVLSQQLREALVVGCNTSVQGHDLCHKVSQCRQRRMPENKYTRDAYMYVYVCLTVLYIEKVADGNCRFPASAVVISKQSFRIALP